MCHRLMITVLSKFFRFEFIGEEGLDAGGIAREWFQLTSELLFNPNFALFEYSAINQMCLQINSNSGIANSQHLLYFHFAGRLLGKALFDGQIVPTHLVSPLYKVGVNHRIFYTSEVGV